MYIFQLFAVYVLTIVFLIYFILYIYFLDIFDNTFSKEKQLFFHDIIMNNNFSSFNNTKQIAKNRRFSKYRKIGYGGHPIEYLFSIPLDETILITPILKSHTVELLIFIHSRPEEFYERLLSRKCKYKSEKVFVIYITSRSNSYEVNKKLKYESDLYKDILQYNEISSYFNLSIQTVHMIKWSCNIDFKYLLKSDIDVYINIPLILNWIKIYNTSDKYFAMGKISKTYILRDKKYSHYIPIEIIKENMFPPYLQGVGYIIPYKTVLLLSKSIEKVKPRIWVEDVFMGYMFKYNHISLIDISKYIVRDLPYNISILFNNINNFMFIHGFYPIEIFILKENNNICYSLFNLF